MPVLSENHIRTYWWCNPDKIGMATMTPNRSTVSTPTINPHQPGVMLADVLDQLGLGIGWPRNENRAGVCDRLSDSLKEGVILRGVPAPDGVCPMVDVLGRMIRVQHEPFHIGRAEMEHACLMVIDPNDRMKVMAAHGMSPFAHARCSLQRTSS
jgi:hypothetical protein